MALEGSVRRSAKLLEEAAPKAAAVPDRLQMALEESTGNAEAARGGAARGSGGGSDVASPRADDARRAMGRRGRLVDEKVVTVAARGGSDSRCDRSRDSTQLPVS